MHTNLKVYTCKIIRKHLLSLKALLCSHSMVLFLEYWKMSPVLIAVLCIERGRRSFSERGSK